MAGRHNEAFVVERSVFLMYQTRIQIHRNFITSFCSISYCLFTLLYTEAHLEHNQISKMENFGKTVNGWKRAKIFAKNSISDIWMDSKYASVYSKVKRQWEMEQNDAIKFKWTLRKTEGILITVYTHHIRDQSLTDLYLWKFNFRQRLFKIFERVAYITTNNQNELMRLCFDFISLLTKRCISGLPRSTKAKIGKIVKKICPNALLKTVFFT